MKSVQSWGIVDCRNFRFERRLTITNMFLHFEIMKESTVRIKKNSKKFITFISLPSLKINDMDALVKILLTDEKKIAQLTLRYKELNRNIENETNADKATRTHLGMDIAAIKKTNASIVSHCLNEHKLSDAEIDKIKIAHLAA